MPDALTRLFLVQPLDEELTSIPVGALGGRPDSIETLLQAQEIKNHVSQYLGDRQASIGTLRRLLRKLTQ